MSVSTAPQSPVQRIAATIPPIDLVRIKETSARLDRLTKPQGSLGRLEDLARELTGMNAHVDSISRKCIVVMAGDHGVTAEGVSAYPSEVTAQMILNFVGGGAGINILARQSGAEIVVVDMGVAGSLPSVAASPTRHAGILDRRIAPGTANFTLGPAMTRENAERSIAEGAAIAHTLCDKGFGLIGTGDMGIGNTTSSSAITSVITGASAETTTGRGTGIGDEIWRRKIEVIKSGIALNNPDSSDGIDVLAKVGGFEIGGLAGVMIGSASRGVPVVVDGFISGAAALIAVTVAPRTKDYIIAAHVSAEPGHRIILEYLGLKPLLDLGLRLGEGTGAALAFPILEASLRLLTEMATFDQAGVSEKRT